MANRRIFYACQAVGIAADGTTSYQEVRGLQSVGINTTFNCSTPPVKVLG